MRPLEPRLRLLRGLCLVAAVCSLTAPARAAGRPLVAEPREGQKIRIDGELREWPARMTPLSETLDGKSIEARAVIGYDEKNLYLALRVADKRIARTANAGAAEDHATLYLAFPRGRDYVTYGVQVYPGKPGKVPGVVRLDGKAVAGSKAVENPTDKELLLEAQIPWSTFPEAKKTRVGLRAAVMYTNADAPGAVKSVVSTSTGKSGRGLAALALESEQGLLALLADKGLSDAPAREAFGNLSGDGMLERVAVFGPFLTISGPSFRGGKEFYFSELGVASADMVQRVQLADFDGDGREEVVIRKRVGDADKYREVLEVLKIGKDDAPFVAFSHEVAIKTPDGSIQNKVKIDANGIEIAQGDSDGFEPDTYAEPLAGNMPSALLPWESVGTRRFKWEGNGFTKAGEAGFEPKTRAGGDKPDKGGKKVAKKASGEGRVEPPAPRPPSADELLDRVYALYRRDRSASGKPRFDFVTDVSGDSAPERVVVHDKDLVVFGKGFRGGTSYSFISVGVTEPKDILDATARDLTGDGKAEIVVRAVMRAKASKALGGDTVDRHALLVYGLKEEALVRVFAAETGRALGKNQILGAVSFEPAERGLRIELRPARAVGWTEESYPFPPDATTAGGLEPLLLPWSSDKRRYRYDGKAFVLE